ncbi:Copper amine oxidase N-terminal domain-containing protein [Geosporobacter subterraneus DSM 17957]|uniref:Copper amine oxidase N-terminal domain-containing protein n=1 Tax=Geosporobacter subterraneus DSM 17957 TaxID=1121919 RepID=A0A1M6NTT5_9FIRM|nr:copper amine oxidase N-terminal domain-containing protein [Geosporobacter subterraneus]SHJ99018.1 Copper amine oxidase N-terminal domain-containing protein [Geosporobacter subterraneus DSM 17957]
MKRKLSLLLALVMILSLVPMTAFAASGLTAVSVPVLPKDTAQNLGSVRMVIPAGSPTDGHKLTITLPSGVTLPSPLGTDVEVTVPLNYAGDTNGLAQADITSVNRASSTKLEVVFGADVSFTNDALVIFKFNNINTTDASNGTVELKFEASPNSGIPTGTVAVANVGGTDAVKLTTSSVDTTSSSFNFNLNVVEEKPGSITAGDKITLKLPDGYVWDPAYNGLTTYDQTTTPKAEVKFGDQVTFTLDGGNTRDLTIEFVAGTTNFSSFSLKDIAFLVADDSKVKEGDIEVAVKGSGFNRDVTKLKVGVRADYTVKLEMEEVETIYAGRIEQELGTILIKEGIAGSLLPGRTITLKLPENARWTKVGNVKNEEDGAIDTPVIGSDDRVLTIRVNTQSTDADTFKLEEFEIMTEAGVTGDLVADITGSQGVRGTIVLAKVQSPVKIQATSKATDVVIGKTDQPAASFVITEVDKESLKAGSIKLILPLDVEWAKLPTVKVTEGDLTLGTISRSGRELTIPVSTDSFNASKIEVTDVMLRVYRTVPEGEIKIGVGGTAAVDAATLTEWAESTSADKVVIARVVTPAPGDTKANVVFTIDSAKYVVNGEEMTMDVAPYIKDSRTFLSIRYVAEALGVNPNAIVWNANTKTVTVFKGNNIASVTVGSKVLNINGMQVMMDTAVENKDGRVMLPIAHLAMALGVQYEWDGAARTVTFK